MSRINPAGFYPGEEDGNLQTLSSFGASSSSINIDSDKNEFVQALNGNEMYAMYEVAVTRAEYNKAFDIMNGLGSGKQDYILLESNCATNAVSVFRSVTGVVIFDGYISPNSIYSRILDANRQESYNKAVEDYQSSLR